MKHLVSATLVFVSSFVFVASAAAQDRYELGRRLRTFEQALGRAPAKAQARSMPKVQSAVVSFFTGRTSQAGKLLDEARFALEDDATPAEIWAAGLGWSGASHLHDPQTGPLPLTVARSYPATAPGPREVSLLWELTSASGKGLGRGQVGLTKLPARLNLPRHLPDGDHSLRCEILSGGKAVGRLVRLLSIVNGLEGRLEAAARASAQLASELPFEERAALTHKLALLRSLRAGGRGAPDTDLPGARLMRDAEQAQAALARGQAFHAGLPGEHWLRLGTPARSAAVRVQIPTGASAKTPLVVALHGMGGSENMFFDAYGAGAIARLCRERGWALLAPRAGGAALSDILDSLAVLHPFDRKRVLLVGHSMGAMQASLELSAAPGDYAAAAFLGGGGRVRGDTLPPCFVGVGKLDFSASAGRTLARRLESKAASVVLKNYPAEHLTVVQFALPDVFTFFDEILGLAPSPEPAQPERYGPISDEPSGSRQG